jgi:hypothetical protein
MESDIATEFKELWTVLIPKILDLAENEETVGVKRLLDAYSHDEVSNGMLLYAMPSSIRLDCVSVCPFTICGFPSKKLVFVPVPGA